MYFHRFSILAVIVLATSAVAMPTVRIRARDFGDDTEIPLPSGNENPEDKFASCGEYKHGNVACEGDDYKECDNGNWVSYKCLEGTRCNSIGGGAFCLSPSDSAFSKTQNSDTTPTSTSISTSSPSLTATSTPPSSDVTPTSAPSVYNGETPSDSTGNDTVPSPTDCECSSTSTVTVTVTVTTSCEPTPTPSNAGELPSSSIANSTTSTPMPCHPTPTHDNQTQVPSDGGELPSTINANSTEPLPANNAYPTANTTALAPEPVPCNETSTLPTGGEQPVNIPANNTVPLPTDSEQPATNTTDPNSIPCDDLYDMPLGDIQPTNIAVNNTEPVPANDTNSAPANIMVPAPIPAPCHQTPAPCDQVPVPSTNGTDNSTTPVTSTEPSTVTSYDTAVPTTNEETSSSSSSDASPTPTSTPSSTTPESAPTSDSAQSTPLPTGDQAPQSSDNNGLTPTSTPTSTSTEPVLPPYGAAPSPAPSTPATSESNKQEDDSVKSVDAGSDSAFNSDDAGDSNTPKLIARGLDHYSLDVAFPFYDSESSTNSNLLEQPTEDNYKNYVTERKFIDDGDNDIRTSVHVENIKRNEHILQERDLASSVEQWNTVSKSASAFSNYKSDSVDIPYNADHNSDLRVPLLSDHISDKKLMARAYTESNDVQVSLERKLPSKYLGEDNAYTNELTTSQHDLSTTKSGTQGCNK
jgi:hypothetical protein